MRAYIVAEVGTNTPAELATVRDQIAAHPDPAARADLAEALGLVSYWGHDRRRSGTGTVPALRVGALNQEATA